MAPRGLPAEESEPGDRANQVSEESGFTVRTHVRAQGDVFATPRTVDLFSRLETRWVAHGTSIMLGHRDKGD